MQKKPCDEELVLFKSFIKELTNWEESNPRIDYMSEKYIKFTDVKQDKTEIINLSYDRKGDINIKEINSRINNCRSEFLLITVPNHVKYTIHVIDQSNKKHNEIRYSNSKRCKSITPDFCSSVPGILSKGRKKFIKIVVAYFVWEDSWL